MAEGGSASGLSSSYCCESEEIVYFYCDLCYEDMSTVEAEGYCEDCKKYLCSGCLDAHNRTGKSSPHRLLGKESMSTDKPLPVDQARTAIRTTCKEHPGEMFTFYCKIHNVDGCTDCFSKKHTHCTDSVEAISAAQNRENSSGTETGAKAETEIGEDTRGTETGTKSDTQSGENMTGIETEPKADTQSGENRSGTETETKSDTRNEENTPGTEIETQSETQSGEDTSGTETEAKFNTQSGENTPGTEIETNADTQSEVNTPGTEIETKSDTQSEVNAPGTETEAKSDTQSEENTPAEQTICATQVLVDANFVGDINVSRLREECECYITGCVVMDKDKLVITDYSNNAVKLVDTAKLKLVCRLRISGSPWDVAVIGKDEIVVTLVEEQKLLLISVAGNTLTKEMEIPVSGECRGVAKLDNRLLVTFWGPPRMEMLDTNGEVINKLNIIGGKQVFHRPGYVCVSQNGGAIYVSDRGCGTVARLTMDGKVMSAYKDKDLKFPQKVCIDNQGRVYVCGKFSRTVHLLTADLEPIQIIKLPVEVRTFCPCMETNRLYVGLQDDNFVNVFDLPGPNPGPTESSFVNTVHTRTKLE